MKHESVPSPLTLDSYFQMSSNDYIETNVICNSYVFFLYLIEMLPCLILFLPPSTEVSLV